MESLSVSDNEEDVSETQNMEVDLEKKRKREESLPKRKEKTTTEIIPEKKSLDPKFRELPTSVKALVEENSKEFVVKGDGPCFDQFDRTFDYEFDREFYRKFDRKIDRKFYRKIDRKFYRKFDCEFNF